MKKVLKELGKKIDKINRDLDVNNVKDKKAREFIMLKEIAKQL